jgi:hypothetical protein
MRRITSSSVFFFLILFLLTNFPAAQIDSSEAQNQKFVFPHTLNRFFSVPNSFIMNSLDLSLLLGSSFGFSDNSGILGTAGLGLGGYGDIEIGSESLLGSMFNSKENFTNVGMKIKILSESERFPALAVGIKANNDWNSSRNDETFIRTSESGLFDAGLRTANYDSRMTAAYVVIGKSFANAGVNIHAGASISDLRYRNVFVIFNEGSSFYSRQEQEKEIVYNFFGGFEYLLNERTILMFEVQSFPYLKVSTSDGSLNPDRRIVSVAGLRFFISKWLLLDSGIRYQDNYSGLAEAEIRLGLNGIWNLGF